MYRGASFRADTKVYDLSYKYVFEAVCDAMKVAGFELKETDFYTGYIKGKAVVHLPPWDHTLEVNVGGTGRGTRVLMQSRYYRMIGQPRQARPIVERFFAHLDGLIGRYIVDPDDMTPYPGPYEGPPFQVRMTMSSPETYSILVIANGIAVILFGTFWAMSWMTFGLVYVLLGLVLVLAGVLIRSGWYYAGAALSLAAGILTIIPLVFSYISLKAFKRMYDVGKWQTIRRELSG
jgi:hypothetical protein